MQNHFSIFKSRFSLANQGPLTILLRIAAKKSLTFFMSERFCYLSFQTKFTQNQARLDLIFYESHFSPSADFFLALFYLFLN